MRTLEKLMDELNIAGTDRKRLDLHVKRIVETAKRDTQHRMHLIAQRREGPIRLEAVEFEGKITFTMAHDGDVMCHVGEDQAKLFCKFLHETMQDEGRPIFERHRMVMDDSAHRYLIPEDKLSEWEKLDFDTDDDIVPDWAKPIGGSPNMVTFIDPRTS